MQLEVRVIFFILYLLYFPNFRLIAEVLDIFPGRMQKRIEKRLERIDGRSITDMEQLLHPGEDLMPKFEQEGM